MRLTADELVEGMSTLSGQDLTVNDVLKWLAEQPLDDIDLTALPLWMEGAIQMFRASRDNFGICTLGMS